MAEQLQQWAGTLDLERFGAAMWQQLQLEFSPLIHPCLPAPTPSSMVASQQQRWGIFHMMKQSPQPMMRTVAKQMGLSHTAAAWWWKRYLQTGQVDAKARQPCKPSLAPAMVAAIQKAASQPELQSPSRIAAAVRQGEAVLLEGSRFGCSSHHLPAIVFKIVCCLFIFYFCVLLYDASRLSLLQIEVELNKNL